MITRRIGAACDTRPHLGGVVATRCEWVAWYGAYAGGELGRWTLSVRFDSDRQNC